MATGGRKTQLQVIHEISIALDAAKLNLASAIGGLLGVLPPGAVPIQARFVTSVAFDGATATISIGTAPGGAQILGAQNIKAIGRVDTVIPLGASAFYVNDTPIYFTPGGAGGHTVGACVMWLEYLPGPG